MSIRILGIESSCDETAAAVVADGREILSSIVASQIDIHRKYGGVVPELASREHLRRIVPVVREALEQAQMRFEDVDAIGVTHGPGLVGSLLVGITYGKTLADALGKPLGPVNHLRGNTFDFSFSGLKTAVLYHVRENPDYLPEIQAREAAIARGERKFDQLLPFCGPKTLGLLREFQNAVVRDLVERTMKAAEDLAVPT